MGAGSVLHCTLLGESHGCCRRFAAVSRQHGSRLPPSLGIFNSCQEVNALTLQVTQLNWRLSEGGGECLYALGVEDNGHPRGLGDAELAASLGVLRSMSAEVGAAAEVLQVSGVGHRPVWHGVQ